MSPAVSVLIANFNAGRYLFDAIASASRQSLRDIEIIFVDDASTDDSLAIARALARDDARIRILPLSSNSGPSVARNAGLAAAKGKWLAVLDSDDMMHPDRLDRLLDEAVRTGAQLCADDLVVFQEGRRPTSFLGTHERMPRWLTASEFIVSNQLFGSRPPLGYLKPLVDLAFVRRHNLRYRPDLRIGEDYDFVLQLLARGARYRLTGELGYFYRKHATSVSHRMGAAELQQLLDADTASRAQLPAAEPALGQACDIRRRSIERALCFTSLVAALKARDWRRVARLAARHPRVLAMLRMPIAARLERLLPNGRRGRHPAAEKRVCVIARQRVVGSTNGSSAYLLSLCQALRDHGYRLSLIFPSAATFGRWPALYFRPEMNVFDQVFVRSSLRIGRRLFVARDPRLLLVAVLTVAERLLLRIGLLRRSRLKPAPYAVALPWSKEEQLFVAQHAPRSSRAVIADYAFVAPAIPYAMCPRASSLVIMHDLFSSRAGQFAGLNAADSVAAIDEATELSLLGKADAVVAIQANEARFVSDRRPRQRVILAPMATATVKAPQPGDSRSVLFVGSNTAPNVVGMRWFLGEVWSKLRRELPDCRLLVAGRVGQQFPSSPEGVRFLGAVDDLEPMYRRAGVVISPLLAGSGLKIKLIEALGRGKAVVATSVSVDGVSDQVGLAVAVADTASDFASAIVRLLRDDGLRQRKCTDALEVAKRNFSAEACYAELIGYLDSAGGLESPLPECISQLDAGSGA
jgi:succinoglycan biosynthesis protein ExoO